MHFKNKTNKYVIISYWVNGNEKIVFVKPGMIVNVNDCSTREWIVSDEDYHRIGKFTDKVRASGEQAWIENKQSSLYFDVCSKQCTISDRD